MRGLDTKVERVAPNALINKAHVAGITIGAVALFIFVRQLPTGTNLNHMDFRASGKNVIEFCDPANPQFIPVVNVRSPVTMTITTDGPPVPGRKVSGVVVFRTGSGKPISPVDLAVVHTRPLHLLIVDSSLADYQHVHPEAGVNPGEWTFSFTPEVAGVYRVFADFTPIATGRGLYAYADVETLPASAEPMAGKPRFGTNQSGYEFTLEYPATGVRATQPADLHFSVKKAGGGAVPMELVMGAYAHLVAFDEYREGFAHLHPIATDPTAKPDPVTPKLDFKITIPSPGRYVIWAQTIIGGKEEFVPFRFTVSP